MTVATAWTVGIEFGVANFQEVSYAIDGFASWNRRASPDFRKAAIAATCPLFGTFDPDAMFGQSGAAQFHPGGLRFFEDTGLNRALARGSAMTDEAGTTTKRGLSARFARPLADRLAVPLTVIGDRLGNPGPADDGHIVLFAAGLRADPCNRPRARLSAASGTSRTAVPSHDPALAALAGATPLHVTVGHPALVLQGFSRPPQVWISGLILTFVTREALRRATGWAQVLIIPVFLLHALLGDSIPGRMSGRPPEWRMLASYARFDLNVILGLPIAVAATIVVAFIALSTRLKLTGGSDFIADAAMLVMGRYRGGSMRIAVVASGLSGSTVANVAGTGVATIPMIKRDGYPPLKAAAIKAVASTGGQLMPSVMGAAGFLTGSRGTRPGLRRLFSALAANGRGVVENCSFRWRPVL